MRAGLREKDKTLKFQLTQVGPFDTVKATK